MKKKKILVEEDGRATDRILVVDWSGWCSAKKPWPQVIYPCVISSEGESLANFYFALSMLELEEDFDDMIIRLGYQACPSPIPKWYAHVWTHKKGESLAIFYFAVCNLELRGFGKRIRKRLLLVRLMFQEEMCTTFTKPHRCLLLAFNLQRHFQQDIDLVGCGRFSWCVTLLKQKG